ncbi:hypothetical protein [Nocardioides sp. SYSU DS0663]|uniref:hypothetical protein n=1 Tax=Nocardioides sp. SYSU DS0663 TaxID=3416445 RepID=UPI003F4C665F
MTPSDLATRREPHVPSRPDRRRTVLATATLGVLLGLAGCSDTDDGAVRTATTTAATSSSGSTSPSTPSGPADSSSPAAPSASASADPFAGVEPATGPVIQGASFRLRVPSGWIVAEPISHFVRLASEPGGRRGDISVGFLAAADHATTEWLRDVAVRLWNGEGEVKVHPPVTVNGQRMYHLSGRAQHGARVDEYGARAGDLAFHVDFDLPGMDPSERRAVIESVLASIEWR